jgi:hypothetical protein
MTFREYLNLHEITCNCGGPQYGTDHAPDCALVLAWDDYSHSDDEEPEFNPTLEDDTCERCGMMDGCGICTSNFCPREAERLVEEEE